MFKKTKINIIYKMISKIDNIEDIENKHIIEKAKKYNILIVIPTNNHILNLRGLIHKDIQLSDKIYITNDMIDNKIDIERFRLIVKEFNGPYNVDITYNLQEDSEVKEIIIEDIEDTIFPGNYKALLIAI
jgi:hypothetical protein